MRHYRDWQFFNRKPRGSARLMQACYTGHLWSFGFGLNPARIWLGRLSKKKRGSYGFHFHAYLPFNGDGLPCRPTAGYRRRDGTWVNLLSNVGRS
jgi:hypothetical protein